MGIPLKNYNLSLPKLNSVGDFASPRSFYYHTGIDLYCSSDQEVIAMESGKVVKIDHFTGAEADPPSPWWNDTWSILIEGSSGVIGYCELIPDSSIQVGMNVKAGQLLGRITPVLKKDKGNGTSMLHLEWYVSGTTEHVTWALDTPQPTQLRNPRELLSQCNSK